MTSIDAKQSTASQNATRADPEQRKAVLFCPACGHRSPVTGNWDVTTEDEQETFTCPQCEQVVAVR